MLRKLKISVAALNRGMFIIAGITLICVMLLTVIDVTLRYFGYPIIGVYDIVACSGLFIIGFSLPLAAERKAHVYMEMGQKMYSRIVRQVLNLLTRLIAIGISFLIGWNLIKLGIGFHQTGEVSLTIQIVYYPIAIGLGGCFFVQMLVFLVDILGIFFVRNNE